MVESRAWAVKPTNDHVSRRSTRSKVTLGMNAATAPGEEPSSRRDVIAGKGGVRGRGCGAAIAAACVVLWWHMLTCRCCVI